MKKLYTLFCLSLSFAASAQCPAGNINLNTQSQVNAFAVTYPNCTGISGNVDIHGADITDLSPLAALHNISGHLWIYQCPALTTLNGLNVSAVGSLDVSYNPNLTSIAALSTLTTVPGNLSVQSDPALQSLDGLNNITSIGGLLAINGDGITSFNGLSSLTSIGFFLEIKNNPALTSLDGLSNLGSLANNGYIEISGNPQLTTLQGLNGINPTTINALVIRNNSQLAFCSIPNICQYVGFIGGATVDNNITGCNSGSEILAVCALATDDFAQESQISAWPNPTNGILNFKAAGEIFKIEIFNPLGQVVFSGTQMPIDLHGNAAGIYLYRIEVNGKPQTGKIVLQ